MQILTWFNRAVKAWGFLKYYTVLSAFPLTKQNLTQWFQADLQQIALTK